MRGIGATAIFNDEPNMRDRSVIRVSPDPDTDFMWVWGGGEPHYLSQDVTAPTTTLWLDSIGSLKAGDWIVVKADVTPAFIADHGMTGTWTPSVGGIALYRRIVAVDPAQKRIEIDIPTRYWMLARDDARVYKTIPHLREVGVEHLEIRMAPVAGALGDEDYNKPGTGAYLAHSSYGLKLNHVVNGWVRNVLVERPISNSLLLRCTRNVTVADCRFNRPQYRGEGGNGYHVTVQGNENLVTQCQADWGRHNYSFSLMLSTGNVLHKCTARYGRLPVDFHMHLSPANLIDSMTLYKDQIEAVRRKAADHGHGTTQSVIWNTIGLKAPEVFERNAVISKQFGWGCVIGTSGKFSGVSSDDYVEGQGKGKGLEPQSLYEDQRKKRLGF